MSLPKNTPPEVEAAPNYATEPLSTGTLTFNQPIYSTYPEGETSYFYVVERGGKIYKVLSSNDGFPSKVLFMDLAPHLSTNNRPLDTDNENGVLSMAFHPDYHQNGYFYLYYSIRSANQLHQRLARFKASGSGSYRSSSSANANTEYPMLTIYDRAGNHNGGDLAFGTDGYLYFSLGDEGGSNDQYNNARFINKGFWGQLLRLDVNLSLSNFLPNVYPQSSSTNFKTAIHFGTYRVPADNPFIGRTTWHGRTLMTNPFQPNYSPVRTEIYATGFRNPFRFSMDTAGGRLFLADVGQNLREEVNIIVKGGDYGWSWREGDISFANSPAFPDNSSGNTNQEPASSAFSPIAPVITYPHSSSGSPPVYGSSITGGMVYRGTLLSELQGTYFLADYNSGLIASYKETTPGTWVATRLTTKPGIVHFGRNPATGEPVLCNLNDGLLYKLVRGPPISPPALLSGTGAFLLTSSLFPQTGLVPYEPNASFWSDYAVKRRWFCIPETAPTITYSATGNWTFPTGTVWIKHFDLDRVRGNPLTRRKIETRFLVKTATGIYGISYRWRSDQSDADLVPAAGASVAIANTSPAQIWRFPSRSECLQCHTSAAGYALGFNTAQLNCEYVYSSNYKDNQIVALKRGGYLPGFTDVTTSHLPALTSVSNADASLEWRVRSYLAVNCGQCHQPGGGALGNWDARYSTPTSLTQLINGTLVNPGDDPDNRVIVPGDPGHSMLLTRLQGSLSRMPPIATHERDLEAEQVISDWINQLPLEQTLAQWQELHFGSSSAPQAQPLVDADGDGVTNEVEYQTGTDPHDPASRWAYQSTVTGNLTTFEYTQPANRAALIQMSRDLVNWKPLSVPGHPSSIQLTYPSAPTLKTFTVPITSPDRFFRFHFQKQ
ncbi:PQQ-dependent sugar dehydrogenase [Prosthecobacter fusiformis]|uniref:PQQ-dependent sugar dehydrogenase n=1 Tax=Prosthecobacter fusiformis TaxID=48464 RepID=UPI0014151F95|nr:PQQ-dependent sugar dehydrogenase [Prosthecobacter fusiformis]